MIELKNVIFRLAGVTYTGFTFYTIDQIHTLTRFFQEHDSKYYVIDYDVLNILRHLREENYAGNPLDFTVHPQKQAEIYMATKTKYATEDIRRNYQIRRSPDSGEYNVFDACTIPPFGNNKCTVAFSTLCIFPTEKIAFFSSHILTLSECLYEIRHKFPKVDYKSAKLYTSGTDSDTYFLGACSRLYIMADCFQYEQLLLGNYKKPCIPITSLILGSQEQLTFDVLELVRCAGSVTDYTTEAEENCILQLKVLNNYNWRDYKFTIGVLMSMLKDARGIGWYMYRHASKYPKVVTELLNMMDKDMYEYKNKKDRQFAQDYINYLLQVGKCKFTTINKLSAKLNKIHLLPEAFFGMFNVVIRVTPKSFEDAQAN